jgi:RNA polymerase sigma factor (sigma-70 family)
VDDGDWMAERFEAHRTHLRSVAYRMLGSASEADDAVQEAWLRLSRADRSDVANLGGWLTTVVARVCLDMLRSRTTRREEGYGIEVPDVVATGAGGDDPVDEALLADAVGPALIVVLDTLAPAERLAFVLHDLFAVPFDQIAEVLDRSPAAVRQLASRARRRVQGASTPDPDLVRQRRLVEAFLAASRSGDFDALLAVLDPDVVLRADRVAVAAAAGAQEQGAPALADEVRGAAAVAEVFRGRAQAVQPALLDGAVGAAFAPGGTLRAAFGVTITGGRITALEVIAEPERVARLDVEFLD